MAQRGDNLVEHAQDLIYYCDPAGRFTYVNPATAAVLKYEPRELVGMPFQQLIRPDHQAVTAELHARQLRERIPNTYLEFPVLTKAGNTVWLGQHVQLVIEGSQIASVQAIARDITRQKDAEDRLRESEAKYRSLIQGAAYGIYRSTLDGQILDANPAFARMLGYETVEEVLAMNMRDIYRSPADRDRAIARHQANGHGNVSVEWKRKDGTLISVCLTARLVDGESHDSRCFEGIVEDVTAKQRLEEQLRRARKMEAVGILARSVAHDFNNVLAAILGGSDLIVARVGDGDRFLREEAEEIGRAAERGAMLTKQLLAFSRRQAKEPQRIDLAVVVSDLGSMLHHVVGGGIHLQIQTPPPGPIVRVEPSQIEQVVMNLVINARDAMSGSGTIDIVVERVELDDNSVNTHPDVLPGAYGRIWVRDDGAGIAEDLQPHIFEPFVTTKSESKGTGLGLSIVYGISKDAGGTVVFSSTPGKGTTFDVLFPLAEDLETSTR